MRSLKTIPLLWTFYRNFLLLSVIVTAFCIRIFWINGFSSFFGIFWGKLITLALSFYLVDAGKKKEYHYYRNLGLSKTLLWTATLCFDFLLFLLLLIISYQFR
jgi:hypothetical protein